ncbi:DUF5681 domain-containing protein [Solidesulfovibrio alcoholivorans]|uniref:DUF5681 domain-containing protein n=1 Tax=Solidesulfovibrio alcoholivorans TaxID=81406 RepID=UPI0004980076|nr:DUF5681 domain-containing protein [Solidesulfovibrio alcoholivorans]
MPENSEPKHRKVPKTAWPKGVSGNPSGKPRGAKNHATRMVQALLDSRAEEITNKALEVALSGDGPVLRAILDRLCPAKRDAPVALSLPPLKSASDLPSAMTAILESVAAGEVTPSEATALAGLVETHRRALEASELEKRIAALEANGA